MGFGRTLANYFLTGLGLFVKPIIVLLFKIYYRDVDRIKPLPPVKSSLLLVPANQLAKKIRRKEITSTQLVEAYIERIQEVQPLVNCVVKTCFDEALQQAQNVDNILASTVLPEEFNEANKPLLGVPFSCKECFWVKDMPNATGTLVRKDFRAPDDCDIVRNMKNSGAILTCLTNTSELCIWIESRNPLHGVSNNPYNLSRIVGGSSGGEAALIASAGSVIGVGSDIGGSIRIPPCFNGVYAHKTTYGLISNDVQYPPVLGELKQGMLSSGPICRYASDLRLLIKIQSDPIRYAPFASKFDAKVDLKKLKYYVITDYKECIVASKMSPASSHAINKAVRLIEESLEVNVQKLDLPGFKDIYEMFVTFMNNGNRSSQTFNDLIKEMSGAPYHPEREIIKSIFGKSNYSLHLIMYSLFEKTPRPDPEKYIKLRNELKNELNTILGDNSIIIAPSFPYVAPYHNQVLAAGLFDFIYFGVWNVLGLPVTQCPMGLCQESGLPIGVQIVSNERCDHLTISLAEFFEGKGIGWTPGF